MDNIRALIVDDSSVMRKSWNDLCARRGWTLSRCAKPATESKPRHLQQKKVDLILCDINMPVMDGLEFVKQLPGMANAKGVPVVMITTEGNEANVVQALSAGARGYIRKPFTPGQVKEHVLPVLGEAMNASGPALASEAGRETGSPPSTGDAGSLRTHAGLSA